MSEAAALGFRAHSGWAAGVAVGGSPAQPIIIARRRLITADPAVRGCRQPYHAAAGQDLENAETWIRQCRGTSTLLATSAVETLIAYIEKAGFQVVAAGLLCASGRPLPDLAATLRSHALIHTAEGEFFRDVLLRASLHHALPVTKVKERQAWERAASLFRLPAADLRQRIDGIRKAIGPPWRQDEKLASLAAWIALAERQQA